VSLDGKAVPSTTVENFSKTGKFWAYDEQSRILWVKFEDGFGEMRVGW